MSELKDRIAAMSLDRRALLEERLLRANRRRWRPPAIPRRSPSDPAFLSFGQQQMWFLEQLTPGTSTYNVPDVKEIIGFLDVDALEKAFRSVVARHEILRTRLRSVDGTPVPVINHDWEFRITCYDLTSLPEMQGEGEAKRIMQERARRPFDISQDLMLRATLVRIRQDRHFLLVLTHHIAWDVSSRAVLYRELSTYYSSSISGHSPSVNDLPIQYSDFSAWQRQLLQGKVFDDQAKYWREQLVGAAHVLNLPGDRPRPAVQTFQGAKHFFPLSQSLTDKAKALSRGQNATLFMTLLAAFVGFLNGLTRQADISVGSPMVGRSYPELEHLIGFFINTTVLRFRLSATTTFRELIEQAHKVTLEAHAHQDLPFEKLVEIIRPRRDPSCMALVQVNFRVQSALPPRLELGGLIIKPIFEFIDTGTSKFDLALE
ncbi:MAG: condensation domain-containing protein, partial [Acidobacteriota bacterium]|nr:condensation domain-containing protein [Acidobacteriota bacterium]